VAEQIKTNEREFANEASKWLTDLIVSANCGLEMATCEPGIKGLTSTRFGDVVIWRKRNANKAVALVELKTPQDSPYDLDELAKYKEKADRLGVKIIVTWNMREAVFWEVPARRNFNYGDQKKVIATPEILSVNDWLVDAKREKLNNVVREIFNEVLNHSKAGKFESLFSPTKTYFVAHLRYTVQQLQKQVQVELSKAKAQKAFREKFSRYLREQGISGTDENELTRLVSYQVAYRIVGKILFYLMLKSAPFELPDLEIKKSIEELNRCFEKARDIDYEAIFGNVESSSSAAREFIDEIQWSLDSIRELGNIVTYLKAWDFSNLPSDLIGAIYEELIDPADRHKLGQYFTPDRLVDLILAFCVKTPDDKILDPACGTGSFLLRGYNLFAYLNRLAGKTTHLHRRLLNQVWGFDISPFPAELATINLARQEIRNYENYPHIKHTDFFDVDSKTSFLFPPQHRKWNGMEREKTPMPVFDAVVANPPYIRQELVDKVKPGTKRKIETVCKSDWERISSNGNGMKSVPELSGQADIYASFFVHAGSLLKESGRLGFVTSNAWLDVGYGHELQKFFLHHFKIVALIESRCEPWFVDASINTVIIIVERCADKKQRDENSVRFIKVKKKLAELIPQDATDDSTRWGNLLHLVEDIEAVREKQPDMHTDFEDDRFRIRIKQQGDLRSEVESATQTVKWGSLLRAPDVYFEILDAAKNKLVPLKEVATVQRGFTTGINSFFYLTEKQIEAHGIEEEFLKPVIKSPKESPAITVDAETLHTKIFVCNLTKEKLKASGKNGALRYILWGEKQKTKEGVKWSEGPTAQARKLWYFVGDQGQADGIITYVNNDRFFVRKAPADVLVDCNLFAICSNERKNVDPLIFALNSSIFALGFELAGRVNLGEGALKVQVYENEEILIPSPEHLKKASEKLEKHFNGFAKRDIQSIFEESKDKSRIQFDKIIFKALGLDEKLVDKVYDGLCELVRERLELAKMRPAQEAASAERDREQLIESAEREIFGSGIRNFPEHYLSNAKSIAGRDVLLPDGNLSVHQMFTQFEIISGRHTVENVGSETEVRYLLYAHRQGERQIRLPQNFKLIKEAVESYEADLKKLRDDLWDFLIGRAGDEMSARSILEELWSRQNLPPEILDE
jgi:type I restriction-modification system DNA methylase subunit